MLIAALTVGYLGVALLCCYLEGRLTGDAIIPPIWLAWPAVLPMYVLAWVFTKVGKAGERHY